MTDIDLTRAATYPVWTTDTIRYCDLDPNEHVNNGAINAFFEDGRVRFRHVHLASIGAGTLSGFVLARFSVEYRAPLYFPGEVRIGTVVTRIGRTSYTLGQGLFRDEQCVATAEVVTVLVSPETGKPIPLGDELRRLLALVQAPAAPGGEDSMRADGEARAPRTPIAKEHP